MKMIMRTAQRDGVYCRIIHEVPDGSFGAPLHAPSLRRIPVQRLGPCGRWDLRASLALPWSEDYLYKTSMPGA